MRLYHKIIFHAKHHTFSVIMLNNHFNNRLYSAYTWSVLHKLCDTTYLSNKENTRLYYYIASYIICFPARIYILIITIWYTGFHISYMKKTLAAVLTSLVLTASPVYSAEVSFDFYSRFLAPHSSYHHSHSSSRCRTDDQSQECKESRYESIIAFIIFIGLVVYIVWPFIRKK